MKPHDALLSSAAAADAESKRNKHYKRSMRTLLDSLIHHVADSQTDRIELLESAVAEHLEKRSQTGASGTRFRTQWHHEGTEQAPPLCPVCCAIHFRSCAIHFSERKSEGASAFHDERAPAALKANVAHAWRAAKRSNDPLLATQSLPWLILPKGHGIMHTDIISLVRCACACVLYVLPQKLGLPCDKQAFVCTSFSVVCSHVFPISPGDDVLALLPGRDGRYGNTLLSVCALQFTRATRRATLGRR